MSTRLPKDHFVLDRPYSGRAIFYSILRENGEVNIKDYRKQLEKAGRKVTALRRIIYRVGKYAEEYGYDLEINKKGDEVVSVKLVKASKEAPAPTKTKSKSKKESPTKTKTKSKSKKESPTKTKSKTKRSPKPESESVEPEENDSLDETISDESEE